MRLVLVAAAFLFLTFGFAGPAVAHAVFVSANPAPGVFLARPPAMLRIVFSEPLVAQLSGVTVDTSAGTRVPERAAGVDPADHSAYQVTLPVLLPDRYTVVWHTTSQIDGHTRRGSYAFTVLEPGGAVPKVSGTGQRLPAGPAQLPTAVKTATSWAELAGLFVVTGSVLVLLLGGISREPTRRAFARLLAAGGVGTVVGVAGQFAATWAGVGWRAGAASSVLREDAARWWWLRLAAVAVALLAWPRRDRTAGVGRRLTVAVAALTMIVSYAASGHGVASATPAAGLAFMIGHVLAASTWLGGVLGLAVIWSLARRHGTTRAELRVLLRRISLVAGMAVPAVVTTGVAGVLLEFASVGEFVSAGYGIALLVKLAVATALGVAAVSTVRTHVRRADGLPPRRFRTHLWAEAGLGLVVLVPAAAMSVLAPPGPTVAARQAAQQLQNAADPAAAFAGTSRLGGHRLELSLTPGTAGPNAVAVEVAGRFATTDVQVWLSGPSGSVTTRLPRTGYDHDPATHTIYQGMVNLGGSGTWQAVVIGGGTSSPRILVAVPSASRSVTPPGESDIGGWLVAIAVLGALGVFVGAARAVPMRRMRRISVAFSSVSGIAVFAVATALTFTAHPAGTARVGAPWGIARRAPVTVLPGAHIWPIGAPNADLMMPAVGADGSVWIGEMAANELARFDPQTNVVEQITVPGGYQEIMGLAVDADNHVWFAEEHGQTMGMFDPATGHFRRYALPGHEPAPVGVAIGAEGTVWFTAMNGNWIGRLDPATGHVAEYPIPTRHALPYWIAVAPNGDVWFAEFGAGEIGVLHPTTGQVVEYALPTGSNPAGIAVDRSGTVWASTIQGLLVRLDPGAAAVRTFHAPAADDYGVCVGSDDTVWLGDASAYAVYSFDPATAEFRRHSLPTGSDPWWVATGPHDVWVALGAEAQGGLAQVGGAGY